MEMEPLYKTYSKCTLEEYKKFNKALLINSKYYLKIAIYEIIVLILAILLQNMFLLIFLIIYPILLFLIRNKNIKKVFDSNKITVDMDVNYEFYDDYFIVKQKMGEAKVEYSQLNSIIETKDNLYLMIAINQGYMLKKSNFPDGLENFLKSKENIKIKKA